MKTKMLCCVLVAMSQYFAIDPIARIFTKAGGAATGNAKFFKVVVQEK